MIEIPDEKKYELAKLARKSKGVALLGSILIPPLGYVYVNEGALAIINLLTLNFLFFGFIVVPVHTTDKIETARRELNEAGVDWRKQL